MVEPGKMYEGNEIGEVLETLFQNGRYQHCLVNIMMPIADTQGIVKDRVFVELEKMEDGFQMNLKPAQRELMDWGVFDFYWLPNERALPGKRRLLGIQIEGIKEDKTWEEMGINTPPRKQSS